MKYSIHVRCPCTGPDGKLLGHQCPGPVPQRQDLEAPAWVGGVHLPHSHPRGQQATEAVRVRIQGQGEGRGRTGRQVNSTWPGPTRPQRPRISDMIASAKRGAPLSAVEDGRWRLGLGFAPASSGVTVGE
jgi:hypothetical protein